MKSYGIASMVIGLIFVVIFVVVFVSVIPTVANSQAAVGTNSTGVAGNANVTGAALSMTNLITLTFVAVGIVAIVKFIG